MNQSSVPVKKLSPRHDRIALLKANGLTNNAIAAAIDMTPSRVSALLSDPRIIARMSEYQQLIAGEQVEQAAVLLNQQTLPTLRKVIEHRDSDDATASLKACDMILSRTMPAVRKSEEDRTIRIILSTEEQKRIAAADDEMKIVNAIGTVE